jgi:carbon monoxide dehydrogenase subunit G
MKITGVHQLPLDRERAFRALQDPEILARCMPGCEGLERIGEGEYAMRMKMALAAFTGQFDGKVRIADSVPPESFRLIVEGKGKAGFMKGDGLLHLTEQQGGTQIQFEGDVQVGGTIAAVGQRLIDTTAKMMIRRFFDKLATEAPH